MEGVGKESNGMKWMEGKKCKGRGVEGLEGKESTGGGGESGSEGKRQREGKKL